MESENKRKRKHGLLTTEAEGEGQDTKLCTGKCGKRLPISAFYKLRVNKSGVQRYQSRCKLCYTKRKGKYVPRKRHRGQIPTKIENGVLLRKCIGLCGKYLQIEKFNVSYVKNGRTYHDSDCMSCRSKKKFLSVKAFLRDALHSARKNAKLRGFKDRIGASQCTITLKFLLRLFKLQGGRCAYSDVMLQHSGTDFLISIERMDNAKGYIEGNVCLVAREFNTSDRLVNREVVKLPEEDLETSTWSKAAPPLAG